MLYVQRSCATAREGKQLKTFRSPGIGVCVGEGESYYKENGFQLEKYFCIQTIWNGARTYYLKLLYTTVIKLFDQLNGQEYSEYILFVYLDLGTI